VAGPAGLLAIKGIGQSFLVKHGAVILVELASLVADGEAGEAGEAAGGLANERPPA
jgi:hypothetical protein